MRLLLSPPIGIGLELRERLNANWLTAPTAAAGLTDRDFRGVPGVLGGVTPLPLARLAPITLTNSLTDTPCNSGGISLLTGNTFFGGNGEGSTAVAADLLTGDVLPEPLPPRVDESSDLNHF